MKGPIVSIDVSKGKSDYQAFKNLNVKYTGSRSTKHTKEGFDEIVSLVREMEKKLMKTIPKNRWIKTHHQMIFFGRYHCKAMSPHCKECPLVDICKEKNKKL